MTGASSGANSLRRRLGRLSGAVAFDVFSDEKERATSAIETKIFMYQLWARMDNGHKIIGEAYKIVLDGVRQSSNVSSVIEELTVLD